MTPQNKKDKIITMWVDFWNTRMEITLWQLLLGITVGVAIYDLIKNI